jgi:hypothetical protein
MQANWHLITLKRGSIRIKSIGRVCPSQTKVRKSDSGVCLRRVNSPFEGKDYYARNLEEEEWLLLLIFAFLKVTIKID